MVNRGEEGAELWREGGGDAGPPARGVQIEKKEGSGMLKKVVTYVVAAACFTGLFAHDSYGQKYPTQPVEIIVPYTAGASLDVVSRVVAQTLPKYLGQPVVVVNKIGAGGSIAAGYIIASKPDGYKVFHTSTLFFAVTVKTQRIPFDPQILVPLVNLTEQAICLIVMSDGPWKTFGDVVDYGKRNPGKFRWAHAGRGIFEHVNALVMFRKAGIETIDVPYRGAPEKLTALLGGHVDAAIIALPVIQEHLRAGTVRAVAVFNSKRYSFLPDVPCSTELGFPEASELKPLVGYYVHRDTSEEVKKTLTDALKKTLYDPVFKKEVDKLGDLLRVEDPDFMRETIRKSGEIADPILKELGLYVGK